MDIQAVWQYTVGGVTVGDMLTFVLTVLAGLLIVRILYHIFKAVLGRCAMDKSLKNVILVVIRIVLYALLVMIVADYYGIPVTSLVTVLGIVGLAASLALQDTLANVCSGLLLLAAKTFSSGDYIQLNGLEGTVERVDLMNTYLITTDNKHIRIPNKVVQAAPVINFTREPIRRVEIRVTASPAAETDAVKAALLEAAANTAWLKSDPAPFAGLALCNGARTEYVLQGWTDSDRYWEAYYSMTEQVRASFARHDIAMS